MTKAMTKTLDRTVTYFSSAVFARWTKSFVQSPLAITGPLLGFACADVEATG